MHHTLTEAPDAFASSAEEVFAWYLTTRFDHGYDYVPLANDLSKPFSSTGSHWLDWCRQSSDWCPYWTECTSGSIISGKVTSACPETACRLETVYERYRFQTPLFSKVFCASDDEYIQRTYYKQHPSRMWEPEDITDTDRQAWQPVPAFTTPVTTDVPITSEKPDTTTVLSTTSAATSSQPPTLPPNTEVVGSPSKSPPLPSQTCTFLENSENTAIVGAASTSSSSLPSTSSTAFTPSTTSKPATDFIIGISIGGAVFISALALIILILVRKRRNLVLHKEADTQPEAVNVQPHLALDTKPAIPELETRAELRALHELYSPVPVVVRCELP